MRNFMQSELMPSAYITKQRQRVKQFNNTVYLENNDEFEIELFNPTTIKYLAKINLNNNSIGNDIVIRPGERVFLERFTDGFAKKFCFKTYMVEGDNAEVKRAIANNGDLVVKFYKEILRPRISRQSLFTTTGFDYNSSPSVGDPNFGFPSSVSSYSLDINTMGTCYFSDVNSTDNTLENKYSTRSANSVGAKTKKELKSIETGRVEKGGISNQKFDIDYDSEFNMSPNNVVAWKILPKSQAPVYNNDLVIYCGNCGAKKKRKNHAYCPLCGNKY